MLGNVLFQLLIRPAVARFRAVGKILDQLIGAEARFARLAVHQRIVKAAHMAGGHPHLAVHQNAAVQPGIVFAFLNEFLPPRPFDVVLEFNAQRAEVPRIGQTAIDLASGENKAAVLAESRQFVHCQLRHMLSHLPCRIPPYYPRFG